MPVFIVRKGKNAFGMVWCKFVESGRWSGWVSGVDTPLTVLTTSAPAVLIKDHLATATTYLSKDFTFQQFSTLREHLEGFGKLLNLPKSDRGCLKNWPTKKLPISAILPYAIAVLIYDEFVILISFFSLKALQRFIPQKCLIVTFSILLPSITGENDLFIKLTALHAHIHTRHLERVQNRVIKIVCQQFSPNIIVWPKHSSLAQTQQFSPNIIYS